MITMNSFKCGEQYHSPQVRTHHTHVTHSFARVHFYSLTCSLNRVLIHSRSAHSSTHSFAHSLTFSLIIDCDTIKLWLVKCKDDSETANYIAGNTKDVSILCQPCLTPFPSLSLSLFFPSFLSQSSTSLPPSLMQCPKCHAAIEKSGGCNHMVINVYVPM